MPLSIVFFNRSFYPDATATGQLLGELCESLVKDYACRVQVVAGRPLNFSAAASRGLNGISVIRVKSSAFTQRIFLGRVLNYLSYFIFSLFASLRLRDIDLVVCLS